MGLEELTGQPAHIIEDLANKAAADALGAIRRTSKLVDNPVAQGIITQIAIATLFGHSIANARRVGGHPKLVMDMLHAGLEEVVNEIMETRDEG